MCLAPRREDGRGGRRGGGEVGRGRRESGGPAPTGHRDSRTSHRGPVGSVWEGAGPGRGRVDAVRRPAPALSGGARRGGTRFRVLLD